MHKVYIGAALIYLRKSHSLSQIQMARALGVNRAYLDLLESNKKPMKAPLMAKIERAFGIASADFLVISKDVLDLGERVEVT